ncbi:Las1-like protein [Giardia lamblia P15]|uniref:Las1-like protein n=1 Tax=Giardia intestinalis (strain P15) TaxID=658858 RepID=E1EX87_GIAIA|nr:Las1-like protein [Giardia lamblia P15]
MKSISTLCLSDQAALFDLLYSDDVKKREEGVAMVNVIRLRGTVEVGLDGTAALLAAQLSDTEAADEHALQSSYSVALIRTVNGLTDRQQVGNYMTSMKTLAGRISLPYALIDVRHEATHQQLPPLPALRQSAALLLHWLRHNYWEPLLSETHENVVSKCVQELQGFFVSPNQLHPSEFVDRLIAANCLTGLPGAVVRVIYRNRLSPADVFGESGDCTEFRRFLVGAVEGGLAESLRSSIVSPLFGRLFSDAVLSHYCIVNMVMHQPSKLTNPQQFDLCIKWLYAILDHIRAEADKSVEQLHLKAIQKALLAVLANAAPPFLLSLEQAYKKEGVRFIKLDTSAEFTLDDVISLKEPVASASAVPGAAQVSVSDTPSGPALGAKVFPAWDVLHKYHLKLTGLQILLGVQSSDASVIIHRSPANELIPIGATSLLGSMWTDDSRLRRYYYGGLDADAPVLHRDGDASLEAKLVEPPLKR